ncbi:MAG: hypothetical protein IPJ65_07410 [Archangiaceae bacterium]|nr:hypothetical protein [Archangiaceae bacterium]
MRAFAALFALGSVFAAFQNLHPHAALAWLAVCISGTALALATVVKRPLVLLGATHAGLTATWAGTLAARLVRPTWEVPNLSQLALLMAMCGGMAVLVTAGLRSAQLEAARKSRRR